MLSKILIFKLLSLIFLRNKQIILRMSLFTIIQQQVEIKINFSIIIYFKNKKYIVNRIFEKRLNPKIE